MHCVLLIWTKSSLQQHACPGCSSTAGHNLAGAPAKASSALSSSTTGSSALSMLSSRSSMVTCSPEARVRRQQCGLALALWLWPAAQQLDSPFEPAVTDQHVLCACTVSFTRQLPMQADSSQRKGRTTRRLPSCSSRRVQASSTCCAVEPEKASCVAGRPTSTARRHSRLAESGSLRRSFRSQTQQESDSAGACPGCQACTPTGRPPRRHLGTSSQGAASPAHAVCQPQAVALCLSVVPCCHLLGTSSLSAD